MKKNLSCFLVCALLIPGSGLSAAERPAKAPPHLSSLLDDSSWTNSRAKRDWEQKRKELKREWMEVLGEFPKHKPPLKTEVLSSEELPEFKRQHIRYQVEPGRYTDGYLLTPKGAGKKLPAIVVFHATTPFGARGPVGLEPAYPEEKWHGVQFVRRGYLVWCPRNYINTAGADYAGNAAALLAQHPNWTGMTRMTWDAIRAADFMESWPQVDRKRLACFGHSLGGKEVLYAMAFDERYCAGISSEGGIGINFSNWDANWYLGPKVHQPGFRREHHELLALAAPRPFLLLAGDSADDQRSEAFIDAVRPVYGLYQARENLEFFNHHQGHTYGPQAQSIAAQFLARHLNLAQ